MPQDFEQAITQEFQSISALQNRVYPHVAKEANAGQGVPYLIYTSSPGVRDKALDGYLQSKEVRGELNVITARYADMKPLVKQVIDKIISFEGRQIGTSGPAINELQYMQPIEFYENQPQLYRTMIEFVAYFDEEVDQP